MKQYRPLILRGNRFLGSSLLEKQLITNEQLEAANEKLLEAIQGGNLQVANILSILVYETQALEEAAMVDRIVQDYKVGLIDLSQFSMAHFNEMHVDPDLCLATYTVPFDKVEDFTLLATSYYLSRPVLKHWEDLFEGHVIWYYGSMASIPEAIERGKAAAAAGAAAEEKENA